MFEILGLFVATVVSFVLAGIVGLMYGAIAWLILRRRGRATLKWPLAVAFCLPILCAGYLCVLELAWTILIPAAHENVFGDISEPLPNGYVLTGLAKMPDYSSVGNPAEPSSPVPPGYVGKIGVEGATIFTSISRPFGEPEHPGSDRGFYEFDTSKRIGWQFATLAQMESAVDHRLNLVPTEEFRSSDPVTRRVRRLGNILRFAPVFGSLLLYLVYLFRLRQSREIQYA